MYNKFMSSGFCYTSEAGSQPSGSTEITLYNPSADPIEANIIAYFTNRPLFRLRPFLVGAEKNISLSFPELIPEVFRNCGFWGAKVSSKKPLIMNILSGSRLQPQNPIFSGGWTSFPDTGVDKIWRFPDGLWLEWFKFYNGDVSKAPFPFNECEDYLILNPNTEDAEVEIQIMYHRRKQESLQFKIAAERIFVWNNLDQVNFNENYTIKVLSNQPVTASAVRYIYGLRGLDEWGFQVHCAMLGIPGENPVEDE